MKKSLKAISNKEIKNVKTIKGGTELNPPRGGRYIAGAHR